MAVLVKGGGGKPEEEKTVTAGTSAIVVNPSSGKAMKKVTVNPTPTESKEVTAGTSDITVSPTDGKHFSGVTVHPTPSQEKTVIPTAGGFKVSPDTGKLLSAVFVDGDSDLVAGNIKQGVNIFGVDGSFDNSHGAYVWKKLTAEGGDFVDFTVSDSPTAYPDGGEQGGYWYEKVVEGKAGIDFGEVTLASYANSITVSHKLGTTPSFVALVPVFADSGGMNPSIDSSYPWGVVAYGNTTERWYGDYTSSYITLKLASGKITKNSNTIKFADASRWAQGTYKWFAIA